MKTHLSDSSRTTTKLIRFSSVLGLAAAAALTAHAMNSAAVNEILKLKNAGLEDSSIVAFIKNKTLDYDLSADDVVLLKNQGLSSQVLTVMLSAPGSTTAAPTASVPALVTTAPAVRTVTVATPALSPDAAYFAQQLSPYGRWILADDNQWYWQPTVAVAGSTWRPYADQGHWVYTDGGWYWASDYPWGWAAFHYGRWRLHPLHGWIWWPDRVWAPAWVTWRSGGDYCGWAPLPPGTHFDAEGSLRFGGRAVSLEFDFGLDWHHFNFCLFRDLGRDRFTSLRRDEGRRLFSRTTIINNFSVHRSPGGDHSEMRIFNHGIDPARVRAAGGRRIEPVVIQDLRSPSLNRGPHRGLEHVDKDRKTLEVYRPQWGGPQGGPHH